MAENDKKPEDSVEKPSEKNEKKEKKEKTCSKCKKIEPEIEFSSQKRSYCRLCQKIYGKEHYQKNFHRHKKLRDEWKNKNLDKVIKYAEIYRKENHEELLMKTREWKNNNKIKHKESSINWASKNTEKVKIYKKRWRDINGNATGSKHRANKLSATPSWANDFFIKEIYSLAKLRTKTTGFMWHVDHIVPLRGKNVCGLHVENNLQVIPAIENMRKLNKWQT